MTEYRMGYAALFSGGKDSCLALWKAQTSGLDIECLVSVFPQRNDSYMFHKPNLHLVPDLARAIGIELIEIDTEGKKEEELEDLKKGLKDLDISGLVTGAVASRYQMKRIENLASELSLDIFAPLWNMPQFELLEELLDNDFEVIIVSVSALGLDKTWLGKTLNEGTLKELKEMKERYGVNMAGEGGEYESLVLRAPNYDRGFKPYRTEKNWDGKRGRLEIKKLKEA